MLRWNYLENLKNHHLHNLRLPWTGGKDLRIIIILHWKQLVKAIIKMGNKLENCVHIKQGSGQECILPLEIVFLYNKIIMRGQR